MENESNQRTASELRNDLDSEVTHIQALAEILVDRLDATLVQDQGSESCLALIKAQAEKVRSLVDQLYAKGAQA